MIADADDDNDGVLDEADQYPLISLGDALDTDGDGMPNVCDAACLETGMAADLDDDGDGVADTEDAFPTNKDETIDTDDDGVGDNSDPDKDGDGVANGDDFAPLDPAVTAEPAPVTSSDFKLPSTLTIIETQE